MTNCVCLEPINLKIKIFLSKVAFLVANDTHFGALSQRETLKDIKKETSQVYCMELCTAYIKQSQHSALILVN